jgi:hypothetical protein
MERMNLLRCLRKYWILTVSLLLLTLVATGLALVKLPTTYQSASQVLLLAARAQSKAFGGNPYFAFSPALNMTGDAVRYQVMDLGTSNSLAAHGYSATYLVADAPDTAGPVLDITVTGHNPALVQHTLYGVTHKVTTTLGTIQTGIAQDNKITSKVITFTPAAVPEHGKKARPLIAIFGLGIVLTISIPVLVDSVRNRRAAAPKTAKRASSYNGDRDDSANLDRGLRTLTRRSR